MCFVMKKRITNILIIVLVSVFSLAIGASAATTSDNSNESVGGGDILYQNDVELIEAILGTTIGYTKYDSKTAMTYWLASRYYKYNSENYYAWYVRYICASGKVCGGYGTYYYDEWKDSSSNGYGIRPIVTLRSNITSYSGSGTSDSLWVLS